MNPLRKHTSVAVTDILAVGLILIGASFSFGGLVTAPTEAAFGEATSFYGTPLQVAREALADYGAVPMWNMRTGAGESLVANPLAIHFYPLALVTFLSQNPALDGVRALAFIHPKRPISLQLETVAMGMVQRHPPVELTASCQWVPSHPKVVHGANRPLGRIEVQIQSAVWILTSLL